jgi:NADH dehydrogenase FAD-containing subunit
VQVLPEPDHQVRERPLTGRISALSETGHPRVIVTEEVSQIGEPGGGLTAARAARRCGRRAAMVERARPGDECTFTGCVPSKTLLETARRVAAATRGTAYGFDATVEVDFARVMDRVHRVVEEVACQESPQRLRGEGIELLAGDARFLDDHTVDVNGRRVVADRFVIATGSHPSIPAVEGLEAIGPLTNESVFRRELPKRLLVLGGGAVGVELAQAFARLGAEVLVLEAVWLGGEPAWTAAAAAGTFPSLVGHLAYGAALGVVFHLLEARSTPWWVSRTQLQAARVARRRLQLRSSAPTVWVLVVVIALTIPVVLGQGATP